MKKQDWGTRPKILGIITARGGSKRLPCKNVKDFLGKPLLAWTIETGQKANVFDRFILTTDNEEIAQVGRTYGIEVPFMRPTELAQDKSTSYDTIKHAVLWLRENDGYNPDWIIMLEPTSPGRQPFHIQDVVALINTSNEPDSILGISKTPSQFSYLKQQHIDKKGMIKNVNAGATMKSLIRNQDVPVSYYINSAIYAFKLPNLFDGDDSLWGDATQGYLMDDKYSMDIDTPEDWIMAEMKMKKILEEK